MVIMANLRISAGSPVLFHSKLPGGTHQEMLSSGHATGTRYPPGLQFDPALGQFVSTQNVGDFSGPEANIAMECYGNPHLQS